MQIETVPDTMVNIISVLALITNIVIAGWEERKERSKEGKKRKILLEVGKIYYNNVAECLLYLYGLSFI